jgi:hypothetical protein
MSTTQKLDEFERAMRAYEDAWKAARAAADVAEGMVRSWYDVPWDQLAQPDVAKRWAGRR